MKMPELPPPDVPDLSGKYCIGWSAKAMRAYGELVREECAKLCDAVSDRACADGQWVDYSGLCAEEIRSKG